MFLTVMELLACHCFAHQSLLFHAGIFATCIVLYLFWCRGRGPPPARVEPSRTCTTVLKSASPFEASSRDAKSAAEASKQDSTATKVKSLARGQGSWDPVVTSFRDYIESDPHVRQLAQDMFDEIPAVAPFDLDVALQPALHRYEELLAKMNVWLITPPPWDAGAARVGCAGLPLSAAIIWPSATPAGLAFFLHPGVNQHLQRILTRWAQFLASPASARHLNDDPETGWFCPAALDAFAVVGNPSAEPGQRRLSFAELYEFDFTRPDRGYASWDELFTRRFRPGVRPVRAPADPRAIVNPCEAAPHCVATNAQLHAPFWLKGQPYSLAEMLGAAPASRDAPLAARFAGGTVYQAFLSALSYHRWHAPIAGTVTHVRRIAGTYFAQQAAHGFGGAARPAPDPRAPQYSQAYIAHVATRAVVCVRADDGAGLGTVAFVAVGMSEVSSCEVAVREGQRVEKGEGIGTFHFGGSSICLVFEPGVRLKWWREPVVDGGDRNRKVNSLLATVVGGSP